MFGILRPPSDEAELRAAPHTPGCASHAKSWVLAASILGSGIAFFEASVLNVALPAIQAALAASVAELQGIATAYTVTLAALSLVAGAAGERFGRVRLFAAGAVGLALASLACGLATTPLQLLAGRSLQGLASALLVPNSLALLSASFPRAERGRAIGIWSGATALIGAGASVLGGWLVDVASWRAAFFVVVPVALATALLARRRVPNPPILRRASAIDWAGGALSTVGIALLVSGIILAPARGAAAVILLGALALAAFARVERRSDAPIVPPGLFRSRAFVGANVLTLLLYFAVASTFFLLPFNLIEVQRYSAAAAGAAFLPFAALVAALSRWSGSLSDRWGPRPLLVLGAGVTACGLALFALPGIGEAYASSFLLPMAVVGVGMALCGTPITAVVLGAVDASQAGVAAAVNNVFARLAALLGVAAIGGLMLALFTRAIDARPEVAALSPALRSELVVGRRGFADLALPAAIEASDRPAFERLVAESFVAGFRSLSLLGAGIALAGGLVAAAAVRPGEASRGQEEGMPTCTHLDQVTDARPASQGCAECLRTGDRWVHLRLCLSCGHVGCCDSSKNRHATRHFWESRHPIVRSFEPGEDWRWCYVDEIPV